MSSDGKLNENYLLALLPLLGIAIVTVHQAGKYLFFGVPLDFLEIDTVKILISGITLGLYCAAGLYALSIIVGSEPTSFGPKRIFQHLSVAVFITMPFWVSTLSFNHRISWPTVAFIIFAAIVTVSADYRWAKSRNREIEPTRTERIEAIFGTAFWVTLLVLIATLAHGYLSARDQKERTFIANTNKILVGKYGDLLILKEYDPKRKTIDKKVTLLVHVNDSISVESRKTLVNE